MSKAIAGKPYTVVVGDTLTGISKQAYGEGSQWRMIWKANQTVLRSGDPDIIFPGEVINIPVNPLSKIVETNDDDVTISGKDKDEMTIVIDGVELAIESGRVIRTMDTCADGWTASLSWDPDNSEMYDILRPTGYKRASVYLGNILVVDGLLYGQKFQLKSDRRSVDLTGWSYTADMIDSVIRPPYEQNKITLQDRAIELIEPLGIGINFEATDADEQFARVTCGPEEKIFDHLASLAEQRKVLISSTRRGDALFWRANTDTKPVGTIEEDRPPYQSMEVNFNGRERFNVYTAIGQSPQKRGRKGKDKKLIGIAKDSAVPRTRFTAFNVTESTIGNIQNAADWKRSKQVATALNMTFPVDSWYSPENKLWEENTLVTVVSPSVYIKDGFDFLIRAVEYEFTGSGTTAILSLIPPQAYTGEEVDEPWAI